MTRCCILRHVTSCGAIIVRAVAKFVVPRCCIRQETTCCSMPRHCSLFRSKKQHAAAFRDIARHGVLCHGFVCCAMATRMKKNNLCSIGCHSGIVAFVLALCFLWRLLLCCFFRGKKQSTCLALVALAAWWSWCLVASLILRFFAVALCIPPQHSAA